MARINVPSVVDNATMQAYYNSSNVLKSYYIYPNEGYAVHSTAYDTYARDPETDEDTDVILPGFIPYPSFVGAEADYDFTVVVNDVYTYTDENNIEVSIPISKVGAKEIYCIPVGTIPENQIFNNGNDHEVASTNVETETN